MLSILIQFFEVFQNQLGLFAWIIDLLAKSLLLIIVIRHFEQSYTYNTSSGQKHKIWLIAVVLLGLLPFSSYMVEPLFQGLLPDSNLSIITVLVPSTVGAASNTILGQSQHWLSGTTFVYLFVLSCHLLKLVLSLYRIRSIEQATFCSNEQETLALLQKLRHKLGVSRQVAIGSNDSIRSPMTFGFRRPTIILPSDSCNWDISMLESVLLHELGHIKRNDWLVFIFAYLVASIQWFNPFIWHSLTRLQLEAEFSCDNIVLNNGKPPGEFATQILAIAKKSFESGRSELLAQSIVENSDLSLRVENILSTSQTKQPRSTLFIVMPLLALAFVFTLISSGNVLAIEDESDYPSESLRLHYSEPPQYPERAMARGVKGYTQVSFTVDENGDVLKKSVNVERSEPNRYFERASVAALDSFKFKPRMVRGKAIATLGVRYTFTYDM